MKKISWFKRLFMSWDSIVNYIQTNGGSSSLNPEQEENLLKEKEKTILAFAQHVETLKKDNEELKTEIIELRNDVKHLSKGDSEKTSKITHYESRIQELNAKLSERQQANEYMREAIFDKLGTLQKIESTFFGKSGNKGKGELGEMLVKTILESADFPSGFWVENFQVGKYNVEFAIKSGEDGKYIPVDSKVLDTKLDEEGRVIIDDDFIKKIKAQAKEVSKYLSKERTAGYGIMVLQSDSIYMELYKTYPNIFKEVLNDTRVHISSPSSFVQFAWSIANIVEIYERVHQDEKIFIEMEELLSSITTFVNNMKETHHRFNLTMDKNFPTIIKKRNVLIPKLNKSGKLKTVEFEKSGGEDDKEEQEAN